MLNGRRGTYQIRATFEKEEKRRYLTISGATEPGHDRFVTPMTNRREREASERGNGKAMHAGPIRHPHKINQLACSFARSRARSFVLINETQRASARHVDLLDAVANAIVRPYYRPGFVLSIIFVASRAFYRRYAR